MNKTHTGLSAPALEPYVLISSKFWRWRQKSQCCLPSSNACKL